MSEIEKYNETLTEISNTLFGGTMALMVVEPEKLALLKDNARYFKRETFRQLRDNIKADKKLSSVPLCYRMEDGSLEVLSGNHRVKAAISAGLEKILVLVITEQLEKSRRIAIQLSHNSLVGEDDASILASLWAQVDSIADKLYSGLDSELVNELPPVELINFSTPQVPAHAICFMFTDGEEERLSRLLEMLEDEARRSKVIYVAPAESYGKFFKLLQDVKGAEKIRDNSLALLRLMELGEEHLAGLEEKTEAAQ